MSLSRQARSGAGFRLASSAALLVVIAVNGLLIYLALDTFPGSAGEDGFDMSNDYGRVLDGAARQAQLGWHIEAGADGRPRDPAPAGSRRPGAGRHAECQGGRSTSARAAGNGNAVATRIRRMAGCVAAERLASGQWDLRSRYRQRSTDAAAPPTARREVSSAIAGPRQVLAAGRPPAPIAACPRHPASASAARAATPRSTDPGLSASGRYYRERLLDPACAAAPGPADRGGSDPLRRADRHRRAAELTLAVDGLQCGACVWLIESCWRASPACLQRPRQHDHPPAAPGLARRAGRGVASGRAGRGLGYRLVPFEQRHLPRPATPPAARCCGHWRSPASPPATSC